MANDMYDDDDTQTIDDLVERELYGDATDEEVAWLCSPDGIKQWRATLVRRKNLAAAEIHRLQFELREAYERGNRTTLRLSQSLRELKMEIAVVEERLARIKTLAMPAPGRPGWHPPHVRNERFRMGYLDGWCDAIRTVRRLMLAERLSREQALGKLEAHVRGPLQEWYAADKLQDIVPPYIAEADRPLNRPIKVKSSLT